MLNLTTKLFRKIFDFSSIYCKKHIYAIKVTIILCSYKNKITLILLFRSMFCFLSRGNFSLCCIWNTYMFGVGGGLFGSSPRKFWDEVVQIKTCVFVKQCIIHQRKLFSFLKCWYFLTLSSVSEWECISSLVSYLQLHELYLKGSTSNRRETYLIIPPIYFIELLTGLVKHF